MATLPKHKSIIGSESTCGTEAADLPSFVEFTKQYLGFDTIKNFYQEAAIPNINSGRNFIISTPRSMGHRFWKQFIGPAFFFKHELKEKTTKELLIMRLSKDHNDRQFLISEELSKRDLKNI